MSNDDFLILSSEEISQISANHHEKIKLMKQAKGNNNSYLDEESEYLGELLVKAIKLLNKKRNRYDIYFKDEIEAQNLFTQLKIGILDGSVVRKIESQYSNIVAKHIQQSY